MILPLKKGSLSLAFLSTLLFCCACIQLLIYAKETFKLFSPAAEKAHFPHFKHNNSADTQYLNVVKLSDDIVTSFRQEINVK